MSGVGRYIFHLVIRRASCKSSVGRKLWHWHQKISTSDWEALSAQQEVDEVPITLDVWTYGWYYASGRAYLKKQKIHKLNSETSEKYIAWVAAIMLDEKKNKNKRVAAMKNVVPKTKEKPDADYAIAVAAQGERNQMQDLKRVGSTRIREKHQGAEVGRYCLCRYCDVGCEYTLDKTARKCITNTTYGSFRYYLI